MSDYGLDLMTSALAGAPSVGEQIDPPSNSFPGKLHRMLGDIENTGDGIMEISWAPHGRCFAIRDKEVFMKKMIPKYFYQLKYISFQRHLNLYGFKKLQNEGPDKGAYHHEFFLRGRRQLAESIRRGKPKRDIGKSKASDDEPNFYAMPPLPNWSMQAEITGHNSKAPRTWITNRVTPEQQKQQQHRLLAGLDTLSSAAGPQGPFGGDFLAANLGSELTTELLSNTLKNKYEAAGPKGGSQLQPTASSAPEPSSLAMQRRFEKRSGPRDSAVFRTSVHPTMKLMQVGGETELPAQKKDDSLPPMEPKVGSVGFFSQHNAIVENHLAQQKHTQPQAFNAYDFEPTPLGVNAHLGGESTGASLENNTDIHQFQQIFGNSKRHTDIIGDANLLPSLPSAGFCSASAGLASGVGSSGEDIRSSFHRGEF